MKEIKEIDLRPIKRGEGVTLFWLERVDSAIKYSRYIGRKTNLPHYQSGVKFLTSHEGKR